MSTSIHIAFAQLLPGKSLEENKEKGIHACQKAKELSADILLFPEMWSTGYKMDEQARKNALEISDPWITSFQQQAAELEMAVGITFLEKRKDEFFNSILIFDRYGKQVLHYSKVHTCDFGDEIVLGRGDGFKVAKLDTEAGPVMTGSMICYDREFPESARILMLEGAELILAPNACPMEINRLCALRTRAYENMVAIATCNYPSGMHDCNGHSTLFDGIPWIADEPGSRDMLVKDCGEEEGIFIASLDLDLLHKYRKEECGAGNTFRRPGMYEKLLDQEVQEPLIRKTARR